MEFNYFTSDMKRLRILVIGDEGVGKRSMLYSFTQEIGCNEAEYMPGIVMDYHKKINVDEKCVWVQLFHISGMENYGRLRTLSYKFKIDVLLICFSVVDTESFENVKKNWFPEARLHLGDFPIILVGTKVDLRDWKLLADQSKNKILTCQGEELAREIGALQYIECSAYIQEDLNIQLNHSVSVYLYSRTTKSRRFRIWQSLRNANQWRIFSWGTRVLNIQ